MSLNVIVVVKNILCVAYIKWFADDLVNLLVTSCQIKYNIPLTLIITVRVTRNINAVHVFDTVDSHTTN